MKRITVLVLSVALLVLCTACGAQTKEEPAVMEPKVSQMKAICELAVMDCYYHNVAKYYEKEAEKGFLGIGKKDKHFWIEYSGIVRLGVDVSQVGVEVSGTQVTITLPEAKVLGCKVDSASLTDASFIVDKRSADIDASDEVKAFEQAQSQLEQTAASDKTFLSSAQQRAQTLLEEYITNIGNAMEEPYAIRWIYVDANGNPRGAQIPESAPADKTEAAGA